MDEKLIDLRSAKNPKARIKIMKGHFATSHFHINNYIDISTIKVRHMNCREAARVLTEDEHDGKGYFFRKRQDLQYPKIFHSRRSRCKNDSLFERLSASVQMVLQPRIAGMGDATDYNCR